MESWYKESITLESLLCHGSQQCAQWDISIFCARSCDILSWWLGFNYHSSPEDLLSVNRLLDEKLYLIVPNLLDPGNDWFLPTASVEGKSSLQEAVNEALVKTFGGAEVIADLSACLLTTLFACIAPSSYCYIGQLELTELMWNILKICRYSF